MKNRISFTRSRIHTHITPLLHYTTTFTYPIHTSQTKHVAAAVTRATGTVIYGVKVRQYFPDVLVHGCFTRKVVEMWKWWEKKSLWPK